MADYMNPELSPWLNRYHGLESDKVLFDRARVPGEPIADIHEIESFRIESAVMEALGRLYLPGKADIAILRQIVDDARAHCANRYTAVSDYLNKHYSPGAEAFRFDFIPPRCLTGPAGVGKSALFNALGRVLPRSSAFSIGSHHQEVTHTPMTAVTVVDSTSSLSDLLRKLLPKDFELPKQLRMSRLAEICTRQLHRLGVSMLLLDEVQFITQSAAATTEITKTLLQFSQLGVPVVYAANFSLVKELKKRAEQHTQRLMYKPIQLLPPESDSRDWVDYLHEVKRVLGESFSVDPEQHASTLYRITAGLRRIFIRLIATTYRAVWYDGRRAVALSDLAMVFESPEFDDHRTQVKAMLSLHPTKGQMKFISPLPVPDSVSRDQKMLRTQLQAEAMTQKILDGLTYPSQRETVDEQRATAADLLTAEPKKRVIRKRKTSLDDLMRNNYLEQKSTGR